jgi:hypothetical protein
MGAHCIHGRQGFIWIAGREDLCGEWSQAGGILRLGVGGPWYAALPDEAWPQEEQARADILKVLFFCAFLHSQTMDAFHRCAIGFRNTLP